MALSYVAIFDAIGQFSQTFSPQEFDTDGAAEESVAKYNEGFFMGNKIRVEISHGGGKTAAYNRDPGACFRCGQMGHWARCVVLRFPLLCITHSASFETVNAPTILHRACHSRPHMSATYMYPSSVAPHQRRPNDPPLIDRIDRMPPRDYVMPPRGDMPPRDPRYDYPPPNEYRRPLSPPRDYRDYPQMPPQGRYDDYRRGPPQDRYGPPPDFRRYPEPPYRGYGGPPVPPAYGYDRYDRRPSERYSPYPPPPVQAGPRMRTPPRYREEYPRFVFLRCS